MTIRDVSRAGAPRGLGQAAGLRARLLPAALLFALLAGLLGTVRSAHAEVVDFDPAKDQVPKILDDDDMARIQALMNSDIVYLGSEPNPSGTKVLAYPPGDEGFLDLVTGELIGLEGEVPGEENLTPLIWQDDNTLVQISVTYLHDPSGAITGVEKYHKVAMNATDGKITATDLTLPTFTGTLLSVSPDGQWVLVQQVPPTAGPARTVTLGQTTFGAPKGAKRPHGLPNVVGERPVRTLSLQQAASKLVLLKADGSGMQELMTLPKDSGTLQPGWSGDSGRLALGTMTMPDWDSDRQRNNDPPPIGLPNLGSVNVREALGMLKPEDNPLVQGTHFHVFNPMTGQKIKTFDGKDYPQGQLGGLTFAAGGERALLTLYTKSDLDGRAYGTYAFPGGQEYQVLDAGLNLVKRITRPELASLGTVAGFLSKDKLFFGVASEFNTDVVTYDIASDQAQTVWPGAGYMFQVLAAGGKFFTTMSTADQPSELWSASVDNAAGTAKQVTDFNADAARESHIRTQTVSWKSSGGQTLQGLYMYPESMSFPPTEPGPVVVWQAGGPGGQISNDFGNSVEGPGTILANLGIPVFTANLAGRMVKNPQFAADLAEGRNFGQVDILQMKEGVEALIAQKVVDPKRVGITGCSYGGYFTLQSLRTYPNFYAAGNPQCSLVDLFEEFNFGYAPFLAYLMGTNPQAEPLEYMKDSPMYGTREIKSPTLIFHGADDFLPVPLINNVHDQINANGVKVRFLRVKGERHGFSNPKSQQLAIQEQVRFFREQLAVGKFVPPEMPRIFLPRLAKGE